MANPFPGMNPYLEHPAVFHSFHQNLCTALQWAIGAKLPAAYYAGTDASVYLQEPPAHERFIGRSDVHVGSSNRARAPRATSPVVTSLPVRSSFTTGIDEVEIPFVEIRTIKGDKLVTVIEVLSPTNKSNSANREAYCIKRVEYLRSLTHFIEIDLLRAGDPMPLNMPIGGHYRVIVSRCDDRPELDGWPVGLRDPLPTIPVPLLQPDADVPLDLQAVVNQVYEAGTFARRIYDDDPTPPLPPHDADWARAIVAARASTP